MKIFNRFGVLTFVFFMTLNAQVQAEKCSQGLKKAQLVSYPTSEISKAEQSARVTLSGALPIANSTSTLRNAKGSRMTILSWQPIDERGPTQVAYGILNSVGDKIAFMAMGKMRVRLDREDFLEIYVESSPFQKSKAKKTVKMGIEVFVDGETSMAIDRNYQIAQSSLEIRLSTQNPESLRNLIGRRVSVYGAQANKDPRFAQIVTGVVKALGPSSIIVDTGSKRVQILLDDIMNLYYRP